MGLTKEQKARLTDVINEAFNELVEEGIIEENKKSRIVGLILPIIRAFLAGK